MKVETYNPKENFDQIEILKLQEKELTLLDSERKIKGLRLYEYEISTGKICHAEYIKNDVYLIGMDGEEKVNIRPGCVYVQAMNEQNARKKILKRLTGQHTPQKIVRYGSINNIYK